MCISTYWSCALYLEIHPRLHLTRSQIFISNSLATFWRKVRTWLELLLALLPSRIFKRTTTGVNELASRKSLSKDANAQKKLVATRVFEFLPKFHTFVCVSVSTDAKNVLYLRSVSFLLTFVFSPPLFVYILLTLQFNRCCKSQCHVVSREMWN